MLGFQVSVYYHFWLMVYQGSTPEHHVLAVEALYQLSYSSTSMIKLLRVRIHDGGPYVSTVW